MGRHSAPDDDALDAVAESSAAVASSAPAEAAVALEDRRGRHSRADDDTAEPTTLAIALIQPDLEIVTEPAEPAEPAKPAKPSKPTKAERKAAKRESDTQADLRLLRQNGAVRLRCLAAIVLAFLGYTVVMFAIGKSDSYLLWIWIPIVLSGVFVGAVLDWAHRRSTTSRSDT